MGFKPFWLPHLEFLAEPDEGDVGRDACVLAQAFGKNCTSVLVDREDLARAEQSGGELVFLVGIRGEVLDERVDLVDQALAAGVERRRIEGGVAVGAVETVLGEDCAEGSRDRTAAFGVDPIGECRHKLVHLPLTHPSRRGNHCQWGAGPCPKNWVGEAAQFPPWPLKERGQLLPPFTHRTGNCGITWENMGVNGRNWDRSGCSRENGTKQPYRSCFLVNRSRLPLHG